MSNAHRAINEWYLAVYLMALRFLLGGAMNRAEAPDEIKTVDAYNLSVGECGFQYLDRNPVSGIVECWN